MLNFDQYTVLTFDCYGTLIDWETGIWQAISPVLSAHGYTMTQDEALTLYGELESAAEKGEYQSYKSVLRTVLAGFGSRLGFTPTEAQLETFSHSVKDWPAFPDSARALTALSTKYKLAILSNVDDDLLAYSVKKLEAPFTWLITAQQVGSYKPAPGHFHEAFKRVGVPRSEILHVAQSLFHDIKVAKSLGLSTVWVNRRHGKSGSGATLPTEATPDLVVPDLESLARLTGVLS